MRAIVLVDHGSRAPAANALLETAAAELRARAPDRHVVTAHMEQAEPSLATAIDDCVAAGATEIVVALWFLAPGRHGATDIPEQVDAARQRHPRLIFSVSDPLGGHPSLIDALVDRINECGSR